MPEMMVGPNGETELPAPPDKKSGQAGINDWLAQIEAAKNVTGSWGTRDRARNAALDFRDKRLGELHSKVSHTGDYGTAGRKIFLMGPATVQRMKGTMNHNEGKYIGVMSSEFSTVYHQLRLDWDEHKGPHYNVQVGKGVYKACFRFDPPPGYTSQQTDAWIKKMQDRMSR
jgi:hypothetical protein